VAHITTDEVFVFPVVKRHTGDDSDTHFFLYIGFDNIGIRRTEHHMRLQVSLSKGIAKCLAAGKSVDIGNQGIVT
jgi:hypothetical protein